jgi:hypothetical protein
VTAIQVRAQSFSISGAYPRRHVFEGRRPEGRIQGAVTTACTYQAFSAVDPGDGSYIASRTQRHTRHGSGYDGKRRRLKTICTIRKQVGANTAAFKCMRVGAGYCDDSSETDEMRTRDTHRCRFLLREQRYQLGVLQTPSNRLCLVSEKPIRDSFRRAKEERHLLSIACQHLIVNAAVVTVTARLQSHKAPRNWHPTQTVRRRGRSGFRHTHPRRIVARAGVAVLAAAVPAREDSDSISSDQRQREGFSQNVCTRVDTARQTTSAYVSSLREKHVDRIGKLRHTHIETSSSARTGEMRSARGRYAEAYFTDDHGYHTSTNGVSSTIARHCEDGAVTRSQRRSLI